MGLCSVNDRMKLNRLWNLFRGTTAKPEDVETLFDGSNADALHVHAGTGDVAGPVSATDDNIVTFDSTTGKLIQDSGIGITDVSDNTAASHAESHTVASHSDTTATGAELETLTDGSNADSLHAHAVSLSDLVGLTAGTNIDITGETIKVIDSPTHAGTMTADRADITNTTAGAVTCLDVNHAKSPVGVDVSVFECVRAEMDLTTPAASFPFWAPKAFVADITTVDSGSAASNSAPKLFEGTLDAGGIAMNGANKPFHITVSNLSATQAMSGGAFRVDLTGTAGDCVAAYTGSTVSGAGAATGYKGFASSSSGGTGPVVGVQGFAVAGQTGLSSAVGVDGVISGSTLAADKRMGVRCSDHMFLRGGSLVISDSAADVTPSAVTTTHLDFLNNCGELYSQGNAEIDGELFCDGNISHSLASKAATFTAGAESYYIVDATSGAVTVNLPAANTCTGRVYTVKKVDSSNNVTLDGNASETIDGSTTLPLTAQHEVVSVISDGTEWWVV